LCCWLDVGVGWYVDAWMARITPTVCVCVCVFAIYDMARVRATVCKCGPGWYLGLCLLLDAWVGWYVEA
jgi:hypothetical protein